MSFRIFKSLLASVKDLSISGQQVFSSWGTEDFRGCHFPKWEVDSSFEGQISSPLGEEACGRPGPAGPPAADAGRVPTGLPAGEAGFAAYESNSRLPSDSGY